MICTLSVPVAVDETSSATLNTGATVSPQAPAQFVQSHEIVHHFWIRASRAVAPKQYFCPPTVKFVQDFTVFVDRPFNKAS